MPEHEPVTREQVTDEKLVAGQLRALQNEVRSGFEMLANRILTAVERVESTIGDLGHRMTHAEDRLEAAENNIAALRKQLSTHKKRTGT